MYYLTIYLLDMDTVEDVQLNFNLTAVDSFEALREARSIVRTELSNNDYDFGFAQVVTADERGGWTASHKAMRYWNGNGIYIGQTNEL